MTTPQDDSTHEHPRGASGHALNEYERHIRFRLPDPVLARPGSETADDTWGLVNGDPMQSTFLMVQHVGCFIRALLPVQLTGGYSLTFGVWIAVRDADLRRAYETWWEPAYADLAIDGYLANDILPFGLGGRPVRIEARKENTLPECASSPDPELACVLDATWNHREVLDELPY